MVEGTHRRYDNGMRTGVRTLRKARQLRGEMTVPELRLWLRLKQPHDDAPRFRRQHPVGPYVLDFYCPAAKLAVEVDGWGHNMGDHPQRDEARDAWLNAHGVTVVRLPASEVLADPDAAADSIVRQAMAFASPTPSRR
jgi:very-short-patch-repair endonuclease